MLATDVLHFPVGTEVENVVTPPAQTMSAPVIVASLGGAVIVTVFVTVVLAHPFSPLIS